MGELKVYYGWAKIGNVRKKRALSVMFENDAQGCRSDRGQRCLRTIQDTVFERYQTKAERRMNEYIEYNHQNNLFFNDESDEELVKFREKLERKKLECAECEKRLELLVERRRSNQ